MCVCGAHVERHSWIAIIQENRGDIVVKTVR